MRAPTERQSRCRTRVCSSTSASPWRTARTPSRRSRSGTRICAAPSVSSRTSSRASSSTAAARASPASRSSVASRRSPHAECNLDDSHVPSLLRILRSLAAQRVASFSFLNLDGLRPALPSPPGNRLSVAGYRALLAELQALRGQGLVFDCSTTRSFEPRLQRRKPHRRRGPGGLRAPVLRALRRRRRHAQFHRLRTLRRGHRRPREGPRRAARRGARAARPRAEPER